MVKYRIVLTCFDNMPDVPPYADGHAELFNTRDEAYEMASKMAHEECAGLNGEDGSFDPEEIEGVFEVDDCANNSFEVRWYEKKPEERFETDCDIEYVTFYNIHPVEFYPDSENSCKYRGFDILSNHFHNRYAIEQNDVRMAMPHSLEKALMWVDDLCLTIEQSKDERLKKLFTSNRSLDSVIKNAEQKKEISGKNEEFSEPTR